MMDEVLDCAVVENLPWWVANISTESLVSVVRQHNGETWCDANQARWVAACGDVRVYGRTQRAVLEQMYHILTTRDAVLRRMRLPTGTR